MKEGEMRLKPCALGLAIGVTWAIGAILAGWFSAWWDWGTTVVDTMGSFYVGYQSTFLGGIIGGAWAFVDGFITGLLVGWFYNRFACKICCSKTESCGTECSEESKKSKKK